MLTTFACALGYKDDSPEDAIREMEAVVDLEEEKGDW